jgi:solute carrier family 25 protein 38
VWRSEGLVGFYRGILSTSVRVFFGAGVYFAMLDLLSGGTALGQSNGRAERGVAANMAVGAAARSTAAVLLNPVTVVKTRVEQALQAAAVGAAASSSSSSSRAEWSATLAAATSVRRQGFKGLTAGLPATILRDAPFSGVYFALYQALLPLTHSAWLGGAGGLHLSQAASSTFAAAGLAGAAATLLTQPFDMLRTRSQMTGAVGGGMLSTARGIVAQGGVRALYRGAVLRASKRSISSGIVWTLLEGSSGAFSRR